MMAKPANFANLAGVVPALPVIPAPLVIPAQAGISSGPAAASLRPETPASAGATVNA